MVRVDDISVIIDKNLKHFLALYNHEKPIVTGSRLRLPGANKLYFSGKCF